MPRIYKRLRGPKSRAPINIANMTKAINSVRNGMKVCAAAKKYNVTRASLSKRLRNPDMRERAGGIPALSQQLEDSIANRLVTCMEWGYPLDFKEVRNIIGEYLKQNDIIIPRFTNNVPGPDYLYGFFKRQKNKLTMRLCNNIKRSRAAVDYNCIKAYFDHLSVSLLNVPKENIFNYDETNFSDDPGRKKVVAKRTAKYVERIMNTSKSATSVMFIANANGFVLPPYVVYKATNLYTSWTEGGPAGCRYNRTKSGWFESESFLDWIKSIVIPHLRRIVGKKFLIEDNLSTHISLEAIQLCELYDIHFIFLPANATHLLQPLDVAVYSSLKKNWRSILTEWKQSEGQVETSVPKHFFPKLLNRLMVKVKDTISENVLSGFRKCGNHPLSFNEMISRFPQSIRQNAQAQEENPDNSLDNVFINFLQALQPKQQPAKQKKKQINIEAGKSISAEDLQSVVEMSSEPQAGPSGVQVQQPKKRGRPRKQPAVDCTELAQPQRRSNRARKQVAHPEFELSFSELGPEPFVASDDDSD